MDVLALLPPALLNHLEHVLGADHRIVTALDWGDLDATVRRRIVDIAVADPSMPGTDPVGTIERVRQSFPSLPIVVYTALNPSTLGAVVRLARSGVEHVVLHRFDDEPRRMRRLLEAMPRHALAERMLHQLAGPLELLPVTVARAVEGLFRSPEHYRTIQDLADAAGMNTRTLYRNLETAGFHSPRILIIASRLVEVYAHLRDPGRSIKDVASAAGFPSPYKVNQYMRLLTGLTTEDVRRKVGGEELVALLARRVLAAEGIEEDETDER